MLRSLRLHALRPQTALSAPRAIAAALSLLVSLTACGGASFGVPPPSAQNDALGTTTGFDLPSNEGALISIPQPSAKVTVVDAFAPTCVPCKDKLPALVARRDDLASVGAKLVLVAVLSDGESDEDAIAALESWGVSSAFLIDRGDVLRRSLAIDELPGAAVVDTGGKVRWVAPRDASAEDIVAAAAQAAQ